MASTPFMPPAMWLSGTNQNSIPANDNAMRLWISQSDVDMATTAQPGSPTEGEAHIIRSVHTGAQWSGFEPDDLVIFSGGTWYAYSPVEGNRVTVGDAVYIYTSGVWTPTTGGGGGSIQCIPIACSDEATALTTGAAKVTFRMPFAVTGVTVKASLTTAQASGSTFTVDVNADGASILSTKLTIDNTEKTSVTATTPPVVSETSLDADAEITIDIDQAGAGATGLKVYIIGSV